MIWYTISGNLKKLLEEVTFDEFTLETSEYTLFINKRSHNTCSGWFLKDGERKEISDIYDEERGLVEDARDAFSELLKEVSGSLFFPTFRRIEGGLTISGDEKFSRGGVNSLLRLGRTKSSDLQKAVAEVSQKLSNNQHNFVTSISTIDITELLLRRYSMLSEISSRFQNETTQDIISSIRSFRAEQAAKASRHLMKRAQF